MKQLGRLIPTDWEHYERYPLTATTTPAGPTPVVIGVNWYRTSTAGEGDRREPLLDRPRRPRQRQGRSLRCARARQARDLQSWWEFYDQGSEGACVGFGCSRMMSLLNRKKYDAQWLYHKAKMVDEWPGESYEGTSVRAALSVLKDFGHCRGGRTRSCHVSPAEGISAYRWAKTVDEVHAGVAERRGRQARRRRDPELWGRDGYPHVVWMPDATLDRLIREDGEVGLVVDR
jgi:hypothetical protein